MQLLKPIILASSSPRRNMLLRQIGLEVNVVPPHVPELLDEHLSANENAMAIALNKAMEVVPNVTDCFVVAADTIVVVDGQFLGKPSDPNDAKRLLRLLSGRTHSVVTGFALVDSSSREFVRDSETTQVTFRHLPDEEIDEYVAGGSPMDKAGAYGIQDDYGAVFVTRIEGCYYNVMGFPLAKFFVTLQEFQKQLTDRKYVEEN